MRKVALLFLPLLFLSCLPAKKAEVPQEEASKVVKLGNMAIKRFVRGIRSNLKKAIDERGIAGAVEFCANRADSIIREINMELAPVEVTKISDRYRNPAHKPDRTDSMVIRYFKQKMEEGELPPYYIVTKKLDGELYYIYYKPIKVKKECLECHGNPAEMKEEVVKVLKKKYPKDKAVNYKEGDLRGTFKVLIPQAYLRYYFPSLIKM
jgi:hypothetical protein